MSKAYKIAFLDRDGVLNVIKKNNIYLKLMNLCGCLVQRKQLKF